MYINKAEFHIKRLFDPNSVAYMLLYSALLFNYKFYAMQNNV